MSEKIKNISADEFKERLESEEYVLIDVRTQEEHDDKNIAESLVIDVTQPDSVDLIDELDRNKKYLIYCRSGARSGQVLGLMEQLGFKEVYNLEGGMVDYSL